MRETPRYNEFAIKIISIGYSILNEQERKKHLYRVTGNPLTSRALLIRNFSKYESSVKLSKKKSGSSAPDSLTLSNTADAIY